MRPLVEANDISMRFVPKPSLGQKIAARVGGSPIRRPVQAVDRATLQIARGETLGLVGESGCGKSTLGRIIAGILAPSAGAVFIDGSSVISGPPGRPVKSTTRVQMIFQDTFASLNPRIRVGDAISEGPIAHGIVGREDAAAFVGNWLERVGLDPAAATRYPHQFSGGQRQRVAIARALAMNPDVVVCDEPVASLDVSVQAQVVNLFLEIRKSLGLTMLFISHDLGVVRHLCDRVAVMYLGRIVEVGSARAVYDSPRHPYTRALLDSVPKLTLDSDKVVEFHPITGELPSPSNPPPGCHFHLRCPKARDACRSDAPPVEVDASGHAFRCWHPH